MTKALKLISLMAVALLLMGGEFSCTQSDRPLGPREEGFIDHYLIGTWAEIEIEGDSPEGEWRAGERLYEARLLDTGLLRIVEFEEGAPSKVYDGYTTMLDGRKFLNLKLVECPGCSEAKLAKLPIDDCPFVIVRYWTFLPDGVADALVASNDIGRDVLDERTSSLRGRLLFYEYMDNDIVQEAIAAGRIGGDAECENCVEGGACLRDDPEALRKFIRRSGPELFYEDDSGGIWALIRADP